MISNLSEDTNLGKRGVEPQADYVSGSGYYLNHESTRVTQSTKQGTVVKRYALSFTKFAGKKKPTLIHSNHHYNSPDQALRDAYRFWKFLSEKSQFKFTRKEQAFIPFFALAGDDKELKDLDKSVPSPPSAQKLKRQKVSLGRPDWQTKQNSQLNNAVDKLKACQDEIRRLKEQLAEAKTYCKTLNDKLVQFKNELDALKQHITQYESIWTNHRKYNDSYWSQIYGMEHNERLQTLRNLLKQADSDSSKRQAQKVEGRKLLRRKILMKSKQLAMEVIEARENDSSILSKVRNGQAFLYYLDKENDDIDLPTDFLDALGK